MDKNISRLLSRYTIVDSLGNSVSQSEITRFLKNSCSYVSYTRGVVKQCSTKSLDSNNYCKAHLKYKFLHK